MFVPGTAFLTLVNNAKQAGPVGCSSIYQSKLHPKFIFFQVEYLGACVYVLFYTSGDLIFLAVMMLLGLLPTGSHSLTNIAKLGLFLSKKYYVYFSIELNLSVCLGVCYS